MILASIAFTFTAAFTPQNLPSLPEMPAITVANGTPLLRYVDFHRDLDRPGAVVLVGAIDKWKEGKRERTKDPAPMGDIGTRVSIGGGQYFKVPAKVAVQVRAALFGDAKGKLEFDCELQVHRRADGDEQVQTTTAGRNTVTPGLLALFVLAPPGPGKKPALLHLIPFDPKVDTGGAPTERFADTMRDYATINCRVRDLEQGIAAVKDAGDEATRSKAKQALATLLAAKVDLLQPEQQTLLTTQASPFEQRARALLAEVPAEVPK